MNNKELVQEFKELVKPLTKTGIIRKLELNYLNHVFGKDYIIDELLRSDVKTLKNYIDKLKN